MHTSFSYHINALLYKKCLYNIDTHSFTLSSVYSARVRGYEIILRAINKKHVNLNNFSDMGNFERGLISECS